ncbi:MAG: hypothetical protein MUQ52_02935 [Pirellulales bacterium]|nr:hypothetical protein [Pirellulales bacterium]
MLSVLFMVWAALWVESQFVLAGPLAEAVKKAKAAAGVTDENAAPEKVVGQNGVQSALPPTASSEPTQRVEVSTVSVAVRLPITGGRDNAIRAAILRQLDRLQSPSGRRGQLVLQFDATSDEYASDSDFGRSLELARFLTSSQMANVKTIAYLPDGAQGHAVLVALACEDIVMAPDALLGPVVRNKQRVDETVRAAYKDIAGRRRTVPPPLAVALADPSVRAVRAITEVGDQVVLSERVPALREEVQVLRVEDVGPRPLVLSGRRCREIGIVQLLVAGTADLARSLDINPEQLVLDPSMERGWKASVVSLTGPISGDSVARVRVRLEEAITSKANFLCLKIDSAGGSPEQSLVLARWLREINPAEVKTVAYIPNQARSDAALIALACDDVVMNETAVLGGEGAAIIDARQADAIEAAWQKIMQGNLKTLEALPLALVLPEYQVSRFVQQSTGRTEYFSSSALLPRKDKASWKKQQDLAPGPLLVDGFQAEAYGLTDQPVTSFSDLAERYGLGDDITRIEPGWADRLLDALASPGLAWLLLLVGGVGLYIEVQTPGLGFGGFIAMVAFIIYFWSQYLNGTSGWLEVMLFLAGVICLAAEIFVVPGIGILGLGGGFLIVASLVLASQSFVLPANSYQVQQLQISLLGILGAGVGVVAFGVVVRRWLPLTPVLRHVLLVPPERDDQNEVVSFEYLIGKTGVTVTRLAPAGKADIENHLHDVYADDMLIESGTAVQVTAVRSGRIMVVPYSQEAV